MVVQPRNEPAGAEWRKRLFDVALERVKQRFSLKQFQIFDLAALKEWPAAEVAQSLGITLANVYVTHHRFTAAIKKATSTLEKELEQAAARQRRQASH